MEKRLVFARVNDDIKTGGKWMWLYKGTWDDRTLCILFLGYNNVHIQVTLSNCGLQNVTIRRIWARVLGISVLFLTTAYESRIISKLKVTLKKKLQN